MSANPIQDALAVKFDALRDVKFAGSRLFLFTEADSTVAGMSVAGEVFEGWSFPERRFDRSIGAVAPAISIVPSDEWTRSELVAVAGWAVLEDGETTGAMHRVDPEVTRLYAHEPAIRLVSMGTVGTYDTAAGAPTGAILVTDTGDMLVTDTGAEVAYA